MTEAGAHSGEDVQGLRLLLGGRVPVAGLVPATEGEGKREEGG